MKGHIFLALVAILSMLTPFGSGMVGGGMVRAAESERQPPFIFTYDFTDKTTNLPTPTAAWLPPSWKGFNMLNLFNTTTPRRFDERAFEWKAERGFNFVRLPMDYRAFIVRGDWETLDENAMQIIDQAVEYGIRHNIHINLNFHRAPGFTVARPAEPTDLFTNEDTQRVFAEMWGKFSERYQHVPNEYLSFNLVNEPPHIDEAVHARVMEKAARAIWAHRPDRLIIADGRDYGRIPSLMIKELGMAQSGRGYAPFGLTHYQASWVNGADRFPTPVWPVVPIPRYLYGNEKRDIRSVYSIEYHFTTHYYLDVNVNVVSRSARLIAKADGVEIYNRLIESGPGEGEWETVVFQPQWNVYQNIFNRDYRIEIPAGTRLLTLEVTEGDWMTVNDLKFSATSAGDATGSSTTFSISPNIADWGALIPPLRLDADGAVITEGMIIQDRQYLRGRHLRPWEELMAAGGGAMIGEWGSYRHTSHDVTLRWMEDNLINFREANLGWALWNWNDTFGIINSRRQDVTYEDIGGYPADRLMLELLLKYVNEP